MSTHKWLKRVIFSTLILYALCVFLTSTKVLADSDYRWIKGTYENSEGSYSISFVYEDSMLLTNANTKSERMEKASAAISALAYQEQGSYPEKLISVIRQMGFDKINAINYTYTYSYDDSNHVAFVVCEKAFKNNNENYMAYLVAIRGTQGDNAEWFSNFNIGDGDDHEGFYEAAQDVERAILGRMERNSSYDKNHNIVWITGHSRGAAVSNFAAGHLTEKARAGTARLSSSHIHSYNFACPAVSKNADVDMQNVHNYVNSRDFITMMPPEKWGFKRYGQTYEFVGDFANSSTDQEYYFNISHGHNYVSGNPEELLDSLLDLLGTQGDIDSDIEHCAVDLVVHALFAKESDTCITVLDILKKYSALVEFIDDFDENILDIGATFNGTVNIIKEGIDTFVSFITIKYSKSEIEKALDFINRVKGLVGAIQVLIGEDGQNALWDNHTPEIYMEWIGGEDYSFTVNKNLPSVYRIPDGVTTLVLNQFTKNTNLMKVTIPSSVKKIGAGCFSYCDSLEEVVFEGDVYSIGMGCFERCPNLKSVRFGGTVAEIGIGAFRWCPELSEIQIPEGITELPAELFCADSKLESITIPDGITKIGSACFNGCPIKTIYVPDSVSEIGDYAFGACSSLKEVHLSNSLTSISDELFAYCSVLSKVNIPSSVSRIGDRAFRECTQIKSLDFIPNNVTIIGESAFEQCTGLERIQLGNNIQSIGTGAFSGCTSLQSAVLPSGIETVDFFSWCTNLTDIMIPSSVKTIGNYAFDHCYALTNLIIPRSITTIGNYSFYGCSNLENMVIQDNVSVIGDNALSSCPKLNVYVYKNPTVEAYVRSNNILYVSLGDRLTSPDLMMPLSLVSIEEESFEGNPARSIYIGDQVRFIKPRAFANCPNLKQIRIPAVASIGTDVLKDSINGILIVYGEAGSPAESFAAANEQVFFIREGN